MYKDYFPKHTKAMIKWYQHNKTQCGVHETVSLDLNQNCVTCHTNNHFYNYLLIFMLSFL